MILMTVVNIDEGHSFISDFTLPTGEVVYKDINDPDRVGFGRLAPFIGMKIKLTHEDGAIFYAILTEVTEDDIVIKWI